jgi:predicted restriction endonuclease
MNRKEYHRQYHLKNKDKISKKRKEDYIKNKPKYANRMRIYHQAHKEERCIKGRENRMKNKLKVLTHYGGNPPKCACCGETIFDFLTMDHIDGGGIKQFKQIGYGTAFYNWLIKNNYPEGFQVLCYNCNCGRSHNKGICPHQIIVEVTDGRME